MIHLSQARKDDDLLEKAMEAVRAVRKIRTRNRTLCRTDGFPLAQLDEIIEDETLPQSQVEEREAKRARMRGVAGQPGGSVEQQTFFDSFAEAEKAERRWGEHGENIGMRGLNQDPAKYNVPADMIQVWMQRYNVGQARLAKAWFTKARIEGVPIPDDIPLWDPETKEVTPPKVAEWDAAAPKPDEETAPAETPPKPDGDDEGAAADTPPVEEHEPA